MKDRIVARIGYKLSQIERKEMILFKQYYKGKEPGLGTNVLAQQLCHWSPVSWFLCISVFLCRAFFHFHLGIVQPH